MQHVDPSKGRAALRSRLLNGSILIAFAYLLTSSPPLLAQGPSKAEDEAIARLERIYKEARSRFQESTNSIETAWQFGRACFDLADMAKTDSQRARFAEEGIDACRAALARKYSSGPAHYYLAMNLGELARTKTIGALKLVREMEAEFKQAIELDEKFDFGGPHRSLGLLYKDAPGWPTSVGSRSKARVHLRRANDLSPDYPDNRLSLLEAYLDWGETKAVVEQVSSLDDYLATARAKFSGDAWVLSWLDWDMRVERLKARTRRASEKSSTPRGRTK